MRNPEITLIDIDKRTKETHEVEEIKQGSGLNDARPFSLADTKSRDI